MRNEYGHFTMSVNELTLAASKEKFLKSYRPPRLSERTLLGADLRWKGSEDGSFKRFQTNLYFSYEPFSHSYINLNFTSSGIDESYLLLTNEKASLYGQLGKMFPAFGLRYEYQSSFVGANAGYPHGKSVEGVLFGGRALYHETQLFVFNGPGEQNVVLGNVMNYGWLGQMSYLYGASVSYGEKLNGSYGAYRPAKAGYAGVGFKGHSLMSEFDLVGERNESYALLVAATARVMQGVWLHGDYNFYEPDRSYLTGVDEFVRGAVEFWPMPFVEINPAIIMRTAGPVAGDKEYELLAHLAF